MMEKRIDLPFRDVLKYLWEKRAFYGSYIGGICLYNLYAYGGGAWLPSYFIRVHGWEASTTGINLGLLFLVPGLLGALFAGWLSDRFFAKGYQAAPLNIIIAAAALLTLVVPLVIYLPLMSLKLIALVLSNLLVVMISVLLPTVIQLATPNRIRAQASAIYLLAINLVGIGLGPTVIALITDYVFHNDKAVGHSIAIVAAVCFSLATLILMRAKKAYQQQLDTLIND